MKIWLILQTILFESASLYLLGEQDLSLLGWLSYAASHGAAAGTFTLVCWLALPPRRVKGARVPGSVLAGAATPPGEWSSCHRVCVGRRCRPAG